MDFIPQKIEEYAQNHTTDESDLLKELTRETQAKVLYSRMLSGHIQGQFLSMLSRLVRPRRVLEIGTYTGYATHCLAEGLTEDGLLFTIEVNEELENFAASFLQKSEKASQIKQLIGPAIDLIPKLNEVFDMVFIDADKLSNAIYYDLVFDKVRSGGIIIADNVLWSGKVIETHKQPDKDTQAVIDFNRKVQNDPRTTNILLPLRDGLMLIQKK